jgi:hypothetical protein
MISPVCRFAVLASLLLLPSGASAALSQLAGRIIDESGVAVPGAKLTLNGSLIPGPQIVTGDEAGRFALSPVPPGTYELKVEKPGFYAFVAPSFVITERPDAVEIVLNHLQEYEETVNVVYSSPVIDRQEAAAQTTLTSEEIVDLPFSAVQDFRRALPMVPGVIRDRSGRVHLNGAGDNQAFYSLDGFNITNPVSGTLENRISVDAIRSLNVSTSRYSAEYGKGSAGVLALETARGDDHFRFSSTNFFPSFELHDGLALSSWTPRASFSGPIARGRAWFFNAIDLQYDLNIIEQLPETANRNRNWYGSNLSRFQINLTHRNILTFGLLFNFQNSLHLGISPQDPIETSRNRHERFYFFNIKDQLYFHNGWVMEIGAAINQVNTRDFPQGDLTYVIAPGGRSGNYFLNTRARTERIESLANFLTPQWTWHGKHSLKFGATVDRIHYHQVTSRNPYEVLRMNGSRARLAEFLGTPGFGRDSSEFSGYVQDRWFPSDRILVEAGMRLDWDQILRRSNTSPRLAVTWGPARLPESKFSAGIGIFRDDVNLGLLARGLDQQRVDTFFAEDGATIRLGPVVSRYVADDCLLRPPLSLNWSLGWEQKLPRSFYLRTDYIWKRGRFGWVYSPLPDSGTQEVYQLTSDRRNQYSYVEFTLTRRFQDKYPWLLSFARSSSRSSKVIDFSLDNPVFGKQGSGPVDWDAPNRLISSAAIPAPHFRKYLVSYFLEWHTGFPYSMVDDDNQLVGPPNSRRFPEYFSMNLHLERRFHFWHSEWAFRGGINNLTGRRNPTVVTNNVNSDQFGTFRGGQGRVFNGRIRFLGRN